MNTILAILALLASLFGGVPPLEPCVTDETDASIPACYWDADTQGNGQGDSFIWTGSLTIHLSK